MFCKIHITLFVLSFIALMALPILAQTGMQKLTPEEASRPWEQWTEEQIRAKGWIPYNDIPSELGLKPEGRRWPQNDPSSLNKGTCISWSFIVSAASMDQGTNTFPGSMPAGSQNEINSAIGTWLSAADIHFKWVSDNGVNFNDPSAVGDIRIGAHVFDGQWNILAHAYFPPPNGITAAGDLHFDEDEAWATSGVDPDTPFVNLDVQTVALHELGHSLGLDHDSTVYSDVMFGAYNGIKRSLSPNDKTYITRIYGASGHSSQCPPSWYAIPSLSIWGILVLVSLLVVTGIWLLMRKRLAHKGGLA